MNAMTFPSRRSTEETTAPIHDVHMLTQGGSLAHICLNGKVYQLRITRAGKLILTK